MHEAHALDLLAHAEPATETVEAEGPQHAIDHLLGEPTHQQSQEDKSQHPQQAREAGQRLLAQFAQGREDRLMPK